VRECFLFLDLAGGLPLEEGQHRRRGGTESPPAVRRVRAVKRGADRESQIFVTGKITEAAKQVRAVVNVEAPATLPDSDSDERI
jgi:hypothetical protein